MILKNKCRLRSLLSNPGPMAEVDNNQSEICMIRHIIRKANLILFCFVFFSKYFLSSLTSLPPHRQCLLDDSVYKYYENYDLPFLIIQRAIS